MTRGFGIAILGLAFGLGGCMGNDGNPNGAPYATEAGGTMAVPAAPPAGEVTYDPAAKPAPFEDMRMGGTGSTPPPAGSSMPQHR